MKTTKAQMLFLPMLAAALLVFTGCAAVDDASTDVTQKLEEGVAGEGRIVAPNPMGDSYGSYYQ